MRSWQIFQRRSRAAIDRRGDGEGQPGGVLDVPVKARRGQGMEISPAYTPRRETKPLGEAGHPMLPRKTLGRRGRARTKTDTGGRVEHTEAIGRTMVKELGTLAP